MCASVAAGLLIWMLTWLVEVVAHAKLRLQAQVQDIVIVEDSSFESKQGCDTEKDAIVLIIGDEFREPIITRLSSGQIRDSNHAKLLPTAKQQQCKVLDLGIVEDDKEDHNKIIDISLFVGCKGESEFEFAKYVCERMVSLDSSDLKYISKDISFCINDEMFHCFRYKIDALFSPLKAMLYGSFAESIKDKIDFSKNGIFLGEIRTVEMYSMHPPTPL
ncbi:hypothetical protein GH714_003978 [Hevea brasiliensis]|uniref:Uncharacterized protein n=1 Tax=Hevea brasiliensis TaxID=3981 RepID=A0A6A6KXC0_HEVBR|nr:hypothetical protein GH714_003978 [Hevea brasiliensis]